MNGKLLRDLSKIHDEIAKNHVLLDRLLIRVEDFYAAAARAQAGQQRRSRARRAVKA